MLVRFSFRYDGEQFKLRVRNGFSDAPDVFSGDENSFLEAEDGGGLKTTTTTTTCRRIIIIIKNNNDGVLLL